MEHPQSHHHSERSIKIDVLRGLAVMGMVIAHALFFFHDKSNSTFVFTEKILNTTVFTIFVFVAGQSLSKWLDAHAHDHFRKLFFLSLKRSFIFYLAYATLAVAAIITTTARSSDIINALTLSSPPNFTEYIHFFIVLNVLVPFLYPLFRLIRTSMLLTFVIGAFFFLLGVTIHEIEVPSALLGVKALFAGDESLLRFPVLFYMPVVLWGIWWQHDMDHNKQNKVHTTKHFWLIGGVIVSTIVGVILTRFFNIPLLNPNVRWPPSITFLTMGMSVAAIGLFLMPSFTWVGTSIRRIIAYFGRDALDIWVTHLILLFLYKKFISVQFEDPFVTLSMVIILMTLSVFLSSIALTNRISFPLNLTFKGTTRFRKRYMLFAFLGLLLILVSSTAPASPYGNFFECTRAYRRTKTSFNNNR